MGDQDTLPKKSKKFLFDMNYFDEEQAEEEELLEEEPPPPPTFSEEEIKTARQQEYNRGKNEGRAEADASREKQVSVILQDINLNLSTLFEAEEKRNALYERESVALANAIFAKLFPTLNEKHGLAEIENVIQEIIESHREEPEILIEVHPDYIEAVQDRIDSVRNQIHAKGLCKVAGNDQLGAGDCLFHWKDGGALRNATRIAEQIAEHLDQTLAERPALKDNEVIESTQQSETDMAAAPDMNNEELNGEEE